MTASHPFILLHTYGWPGTYCTARLAKNSETFCLCLLRAGNKGMDHNTQFFETGFLAVLVDQAGLELRSACLWLLSAGIEDMCLYCRLIFFFF